LFCRGQIQPRWKSCETKSVSDDQFWII
jgi:hypothetical protein